MADVPNVPGVPPLNSYAAGALPSFVFSDNAEALEGAKQQWGIYLSGAPVVVADTVTSFSYKRDFEISDFPIEKGAFVSYDKVQVPFLARFRFAVGGSEADRAALLASVEAIAGTLTLYDAVSPEATYQNMNITHYDYQRTSDRGLGLLQVDVWLEEVRILNAASPTGTNGNNPLASGSGDTGASGAATASASSSSSFSATGTTDGGATGTAGATISPSGASTIGNGSVQPVTSYLLDQWNVQNANLLRTG